MPGVDPDSSSRRMPWTLFSLAAVVAIASLPYADFLHANAGEPVAGRTVVLFWGATTVVFVTIAWAASRRGSTALRRTTVMVVAGGWLFFHYPVVSEVLASLGLRRSLHELGWMVVFAVALAILVPVSKHRVVQHYAVVLPGVLLLIPLIGVARQATASSVEQGVASIQVGTAIERPDIYFLLLDGYGSADVIEAVSGRSIRTFTTGLEEAGFHVAKHARANYPLTYLSIASTLEMRYLVDATDQLTDRRQFYESIQGQNATVDHLRSIGYSYIHAEAATWGGSACSGTEDLCIGDPGPDAETGRALLRRTPVSRFVERVESKAEVLARQSDPSRIVREAIRVSADRPRFVFAHVMGSHPPFLRDAECNVNESAIDLEGWSDPFRYAEAIECLNTQLHAAVELILKDDEDAIIVIQGDHGPSYGAGLSEAGRVHQRLSILSAVRLPRRCSKPPEDMTAVNTFRTVLACLAGEDPQRLENRYYWAGYRGPEVRDVGHLLPAS